MENENVYYFSNQTKLFYCTDLHNEIPEDKIEISEQKFKELISKRSSGSTIDVVDGVVVSIDNTNAPTLSDKKEEAKASIDILKIAREQQGLSYQFGDVQDIIQIRDVDDKANINGVVTTAMLMNQMSVEGTLDFIASSNTIYQLTPDEVIQMGLAVSSFISSLTTKAREYKDAVDKAKSKKAVDDLLASVSWG